MRVSVLRIIYITAVVVVAYVWYAHGAQAANLAPNASFETNPCVEYFTFPTACGAAPFSWASDQAHSGSRAIKIVSTQTPGTFRWLSKNESLPIVGSHTYDVSLWLKTENASEGAELGVSFWGPGVSDFILESSVSSVLLRDTQDWKKVSVSVSAPAQARYMRVEAKLYGRGILWADDLEVADTVVSGVTIPVKNTSYINIAPNAGFEADPKKDFVTLASDYTKNVFSQSTDTRRSGNASLKIFSTQPYGEYSRWMSRVDTIPVTSGRTYEVAVWLKGENISGRGELAVNFWGPNPTDRVLTGGTVSLPITGTQDWTKTSVQVVVPDAARYLRVEVRLFGSGVVWADDLTVHDVAGGAPQTQQTNVSTGSLTRRLLLGSEGSDVATLQGILKKLGYFPHNQEITTYFGRITKTALEKFQCEKLNVCEGDPATTGYGSTGPRTRAVLQN